MAVIRSRCNGCCLGVVVMVVVLVFVEVVL